MEGANNEHNSTSSYTFRLEVLFHAGGKQDKRFGKYFMYFRLMNATASISVDVSFSKESKINFQGKIWTKGGLY